MIPIVFAISVVRTGCATRTTSLAVRRSAENAAAAIAFAVAGNVELQAGRRRPDHDLAGRRDLEPCVLRLARDGRGEALEVLLGRRGHRSRRSRRPPAGQREQRRDPPARHAPARLAVDEAERRRESGAGLQLPRPARSSPLTLGLGRRERERDRRAAIEARESPDDDRGRGGAVELTARAALDDAHGEALAHDLRVDALAIDRARDLSRACSRRPRRRPETVGETSSAEQPRPEALEAADRPEAATLGRGRRDRGAASRPRRRAARPTARTADRRP